MSFCVCRDSLHSIREQAFTKRVYLMYSRIEYLGFTPLYVSVIVSISIANLVYRTFYLFVVGIWLSCENLKQVSQQKGHYQQHLDN